MTARRLVVLLTVATALWLLVRTLAPTMRPEPLPPKMQPHGPGDVVQVAPTLAGPTLAGPPLPSPPPPATPATTSSPGASAARAAVTGSNPAAGWHRFTVRVQAPPADTPDVPVELLFAPEPAPSMRLLVASQQDASLDLAAASDTPRWVDFVWPVDPNSAQFVPPGAADTSLPWPPSGTLVVECVATVDGHEQPVLVHADTSVRAVTPVWPHGRWRQLPSHDGTIRVPVAVGTGTVEVRVQRPGHEPVLLAAPMPTEPGQIVRRRMVLRAE